MDDMMLMAIAGSIVSAAGVFIFMQFRRYDEQQQAADKILKATTEYESVKAKLLGYTKFSDYLAPARQHLVEQSRTFAVNVIREYSHMERFYRDKHKIKTDLSVIGKYTVEFSVLIDLKSDNLEVAAEGMGISVKAGQPVLAGPPAIKSSSHEVSVSGVLTEEKPFFDEVNQKFSSVMQRHGLAVAREEAVRSLCKIKLTDSLRDFLSRQSGVRHIPTIVVVFK